jgi:HNH endonuclease
MKPNQNTCCYASKVKEASLTADYLRSQLSYNPDTGEFWWKAPKQRRRMDRPAGSMQSGGYRHIRITIDGKSLDFFSHRLAWLYVYGVWPKSHLDHIDRNRSNNRLSNLREVNASENNYNVSKQKDCSSQFIGVSWNNRDRLWISTIRRDGIRNGLGYFKCEKEAAMAYNRAALERDPKYHTLNSILP